jgi:hypothetical protein
MAAPVERLLEVMDASGVDWAVLVRLSDHDEYLRRVWTVCREIRPAW